MYNMYEAAIQRDLRALEECLTTDVPPADIDRLTQEARKSLALVNGSEVFFDLEQYKNRFIDIVAKIYLQELDDELTLLEEFVAGKYPDKSPKATLEAAAGLLTRIGRNKIDGGDRMSRFLKAQHRLIQMGRFSPP